MHKRSYYEEYRTIDEMIDKALKYTKYKNIVGRLRDVWKTLARTLPKDQSIYCISNDPRPIIRRQWGIEDFLNSEKEDVFVLNIPWQEFSSYQETFLVTATEGIVIDDTTSRVVEKEVTCYLYSIVIPRFKGGKIVKV